METLEKHLEMAVLCQIETVTEIQPLRDALVTVLDFADRLELRINKIDLEDIRRPKSAKVRNARPGPVRSLTVCRAGIDHPRPRTPVAKHLCRRHYAMVYEGKKDDAHINADADSQS